MKDESHVHYERVGPHDIKIIYTKGNEKSVVVARAVKPGSYTSCNAKPANKINNVDQEKAFATAG